jgi:hypothetical protein
MAAFSHLAAKEAFGTAFKAGKWWPCLWSNKVGYAIAFVVAVGIIGIGCWAFFLLYSTAVAIFLLMLFLFYAELMTLAFFREFYSEGAAAWKGRHRLGAAALNRTGGRRPKPTRIHQANETPPPLQSLVAHRLGPPPWVAGFHPRFYRVFSRGDGGCAAGRMPGSRRAGLRGRS